VIAPGLRRWVAAAEPRGLRAAAALRWLTLDETVARQATDGAPWLLEDDGGLSMAALAFLVDSTLGAAGAVAGGYRTGVTMCLRCDVVTRPTAPSAAIEARVLHVDDDGAFVTGTITADDGAIVGHATLRTAALRGRAPAGAPALLETAETAVGTAAASVDAMLGVRSVDAGSGRSSLVADPQPNLANGVGVLHGGAVAGLAQRATRHALASLGTGTAARDVVLEVDFLRAVPLDDRVAVRGWVASRSRRFAWAEAAVLTAGDVTAARARTVVRFDDDGRS
jgi:uncharacterized protein (TIGR00369 family)